MLCTSLRSGTLIFMAQNPTTCSLPPAELAKINTDQEAADVVDDLIAALDARYKGADDYDWDSIIESAELIALEII